MIRLTVLAVLSSLVLVGCETSSEAVKSALPHAPADIQACFRKGASVLPDRALTVAEVESLWKQDRVRIKVLQLCGERMVNWYSSLQRTWR